MNHVVEPSRPDPDKTMQCSRCRRWVSSRHVWCFKMPVIPDGTTYGHLGKPTDVICWNCATPMGPHSEKMMSQTPATTTTGSLPSLDPGPSPYSPCSGVVFLCPRCGKAHPGSQDCAGADLAVDHCPSCGRVRSCPPAPCPPGFHAAREQAPPPPPRFSFVEMTCLSCGESWSGDTMEVWSGGRQVFRCGACDSTLVEVSKGGTRR